MHNRWVAEAIQKLNADFNRSADTHLLALPLPALPDVHVYLKDESTHVTGSLKHRLARSLYLYAVCNGWITSQTTVIEASSGSTAISEAYFARLLGLRFIAVMARTTSPEKVRRITGFGGECVLVDDPGQDRARAAELAAALGGHFMDQFTYAERATDWRGNNNIAQSIFDQLSRERYPIPTWIVCGAGTGGTSATIGRFVHYQGYDTQLCVVDPEHSVFYEFYRTGDHGLTLQGGSGVEGIGRPRVAASFIPTVVDRMIQVPNVASYAGIHFLEQLIGKKCGGSTGTNLYGLFQIAAEMGTQGIGGSIVSLICDAGELYLNSYYSEPWLREHGHDIAPYVRQLEAFYATGVWSRPAA